MEPKHRETVSKFATALFMEFIPGIGICSRHPLCYTLFRIQAQQFRVQLMNLDCSESCRYARMNLQLMLCEGTRGRLPLQQ